MPKTSTPTNKELLELISKINSDEDVEKFRSNVKKIISCQKMLNRVVKRQMIVELKEKNIFNDLIHEITGMDKTNIKKMYERWKDRGSFLDAGRSGRPMKLDKEQQGELQKIVNENKVTSVSEIKSIWGKTAPLQISPSSIKYFLKKKGYVKKSATKKPILSSQNVSKRFSFARKHVNKRWDNHIFIDESDFQLFPNKKQVWVKRKERVFFHRPRHSPAIKVICGISIYGQVFFRTYRGTIDSKKFKSLLLDVKRNVYSHFPSPILVMDNAPAHKGKLVLNWISKHFRTLYIPPQSPELNPIETIFGILKKRIQDKKSKNMKTLNLAIKSCWKSLEKDLIRKTISHLNKICKMIINKHGNNNFD